MRLGRVFLFTLLALLIFVSAVSATGPATVYKVRVRTFEIWNGAQWITAFEGTSAVLYISAVNSGQSAGTFFSGLPIPDGTYTKVRFTPHPIFNIQGNDGARYTLAVNGVNGGCTYTGVAANAAECTITLTGGNIPLAQEQDFSATPITVTDGASNRKVRVSFDTSNSIQYQGGADEIFPAAPAVTMTVE